MGISRVRRGSGFSYRHADGSPVSDEERERIEALAIPPAWRDVWICDDARGHIQATGIDDAGRKQYRYHDQWRLRRDPAQVRRDARVRRRPAAGCDARVSRDLKRRSLPRERVLACALRLLDLGFFRIGSERYADENETYGLATLTQATVTRQRRGGGLRLPAKGAKRHVQVVADPAVDQGPGASSDARRRTASSSPTATGATGGTSSHTTSTTT